MKQINAACTHVGKLMDTHRKPQPNSWRGALQQWFLVAADLWVLPAPDTRARVILCSAPWTPLIDNGCGLQRGSRTKQSESGQIIVLKQKECQNKRTKANAKRAKSWTCAVHWYSGRKWLCWPQENWTSSFHSALCLLLSGNGAF